jgi:NADH:ubiquinone oxidoreductase subunit 6 (subunit J)
LAAQIVVSLAKGKLPAAVNPKAGEMIPANTEAVADALFSRYLAPFELASIVLLVAIVGAVAMGQKREEPLS